MLNGSVVLVVGGAGLLGQQFCAAVAEANGVAIVADINAVAAKEVAAEIEATVPGGAIGVQVDISSKQSMLDVIATVTNKYGRLHALVNSAYPKSVNYGKDLEAVSGSEFCENVSLHLGGYFLASQQLCCYFKTLKGEGYVGNIVNIASVYAKMPPRFDIYAGTSMTMPVEYAAIKAGIVQLTRYFAQYYKSTGIRVNCISPGGILNGQPVSFQDRYNAFAGKKGLLDSVDLRGTLLYLLSDASQFLTGQDIVVDDGWSL